MSVKQEVIKLHDIDGISRLTGTDAQGNAWIQFEVDTLAEQDSGECCICGAELWSGWMCLDGGDEVCDEHVETNPSPKPEVEHRREGFFVRLFSPRESDCTEWMGPYASKEEAMEELADNYDFDEGE